MKLCKTYVDLFGIVDKWCVSPYFKYKIENTYPKMLILIGTILSCKYLCSYQPKAKCVKKKHKGFVLI